MLLIQITPCENKTSVWLTMEFQSFLASDWLADCLLSIQIFLKMDKISDIFSQKCPKIDDCRFIQNIFTRVR